MASAKSKMFICGGVLLITAALCMIGYNLWDARRAAESAEQAVRGMETQMSAECLEPYDAGSGQLETPAYLLDPTIEMPTVTLDGNEYIGVLEIPSLELVLPVMSEWSYPNLKLAPCRYVGSAYLDDLVIAAHNYPAHFGKLGTLDDGAAVVFTDGESHVFSYTVSEIEQLSATAVEDMQTGDWDLTLFTCTVGGKARIAVRCDRVPDAPKTEKIS